ncbi:protein modifying enzyme [Lithospermum erythrorhizon]|uniref:S-acyltransferase n=1 Tax=Lithospermum erythrorhizon TaxID=34254 RepID=A0AAV3NIP6_LITER
MYRSGVGMAWNVFKFCTALKGLGSIMVLLVLSLIGVTYYSVVLACYGPDLFHGGLDTWVAILVLILFHGLLVMLLWSYFSVVLTDPGVVPPNWRPEYDEEEGVAEPITTTEFGASPLNEDGLRVRFCRKCNQLKPPRCHHCSVCGRCVLKMDHHCVWVVNCVGALNYKYFLLFLFYTFLETTLVSLSLLKYFIEFFGDEEIPNTPGTLAATFLSFVLNLAFALSVMGFLIMHISLVFGNTTTIEAYEKGTSPKWQYDLGRRRNFEQVFGADKRYWLIPVYSEEDIRRIPALQGLEYPSKPDTPESDTLQDFCIADLKATVLVNGFPCKPATKVSSHDFFFDGLTKKGNTSKTLGVGVIAGNVLTFPALNTLGLSMNLVDFAPGGLNQPHSHPRATESGVVIKGKLLVGFVTSGHVYYSKVLRKGGMFVIPQGLVHFQKNVGKGNAQLITAFNSQLPGSVVVAPTLFGSKSKPTLPDDVLTASFQVDQTVIDEIKSKFLGA